MPVINPELLRQVDLFSLMDDQEIEVLAQQLDQVTYLAGQRIFSLGDKGGTMYLVQSGLVEIYIRDKNGEHVTLTEVTQGGLFGEMSLLDNARRSANARAVKDTTVFMIDRNDLQLLIKAQPDAALDMMSMLSKRIRETDLLLTDKLVARNVNEEMAETLNWGQRLSDFLTRIAGDIRFVYFNFFWFGIWIIVNLRIIPGLTPFDPFPFGLLTMIVSLEAIFLSLFVLISQNRQAARDKIRNDIEYEVNVKAELEIRELHEHVEQLQDLMLDHLSKINTVLKASTNTHDGVK